MYHSIKEHLIPIKSDDERTTCDTADEESLNNEKVGFACYECKCGAMQNGISAKMQ